MKRDEVKIGGVYTAKVTDKLVPVRIDAKSRYGGWDAVNLATGKKVRIKSPQRLRAEVKADGAKPAEVADAADAVGTAVDGKHLGGIAAAGQEKARVRDERQKSPDGMTVSERAMSASKTTTCPNCGSTEVDEDGDCAKCREPKVANSNPKKGKGAKKATTSPTAAAKGKKKAKGTTKAKPKTGATRAKQGGQTAKKPSGLDAAARVLAESKEPMGVRQIVDVALEKGYWKSGGKTPWATIYSAIVREIAAKGTDSRFKKVDRGRFTVNR